VGGAAALLVAVLVVVSLSGANAVQLVGRQEEQGEQDRCKRGEKEGGLSPCVIRALESFCDFCRDEFQVQECCDAYRDVQQCLEETLDECDEESFEELRDFVVEVAPGICAGSRPSRSQFLVSDSACLGFETNFTSPTPDEPEPSVPPIAPVTVSPTPPPAEQPVATALPETPGPPPSLEPTGPQETPFSSTSEPVPGPVNCSGGLDNLLGCGEKLYKTLCTRCSPDHLDQRTCCDAHRLALDCFEDLAEQCVGNADFLKVVRYVADVADAACSVDVPDYVETLVNRTVCRLLAKESTPPRATAVPMPTSGGPGVPRPRELDLLACFPGHATVRLDNGRTKSMFEVEVGDRVRVAGGRVSEVFAFTHRDRSSASSFVVLQTRGRAIELSAGHYIFTTDGLKTAGSVLPGDLLLLADRSTSRVESVGTKKGRGIFNPQTLDGTLVVDGFEVSCYTQAVQPILAHLLLALPRALYRIGLREPLGSAFYFTVPDFVGLRYLRGPSVYQYWSIN